MSFLPLALLTILQLGAIDGQVVSASSQEPISDARILLTRVDGRLADSIVGSTDDRGKFLIPGIPAGTYRVFVTHPDYVRAEASSISILAGQRNAGMTLSMIRTGVITGRITDSNGDPLSKVYVRATGSNSVWETQSNDMGEYRLYGLPPGAYVISAAPYTAPSIENGVYRRPTPPRLDSRGEGAAMMAVNGVLQSGGFIDPLALTGRQHVEVFYPGTTEPSAATPIQVEPGAVLRSVDLRTVTAPVAGR